MVEMFNTLSHPGNANEKQLGFYLTPVRKAKIKNTSDAGDVEEQELLYC